MIRTAGSCFDPHEKEVYFLASDVTVMGKADGLYDHLLIAVNEVKDEACIEFLEHLIASGRKVFLDSGIFNLTNEHARKHGVRMDEALALAPDEIDGFDKLLQRYLAIIDRIGDKLWGYIELDQGGRENKIKTRAMLEGKGLRPIPVYHPFNDGWDYFDYLAERYDRICFGNVVQADIPTRKRLLATAWERKRKYPHLWIHLLGYTPNPILSAFPSNSCDSSTWLACLRWTTGTRERCGNEAFGHLPRDFAYVLGSEVNGPHGSRQAVRLSAYSCNMSTRNWRNLSDAYRELD